MKLEDKINNAKKNKWMVLALLIIAVIAGISGLITDSKEIKNLISESFLKERTLYKKIEKLNTGVQASYFNKLLGEPVMIEPWRNEMFPNYKEYVYVNDDFFVNSIADDSNAVLYYAVTTRKQNFNPELPFVFGENLKLGEAKISEFNPALANVFLDFDSRHLYYHEFYYYGGVGNYKYYLIGYSPSGSNVKLSESKYSIPEIAMEEDEDVKHRKVGIFRKSLVPNIYGVISEKADFKFREIISEEYEIGVDINDAINFK